MIRNATVADAQAIAQIYNPYVKGSVVTFEESEVTIAEMAARIERTVPTYPWIVWDEGGLVLGYAYASTFRARHAFRYTVESAVYLAMGSEQRGLGTKLYRKLIDELSTRGFHSVVACIALPNPASVALHEKLGFLKVGHMRESGWKFERWVDIGFWELHL